MFFRLDVPTPEILSQILESNSLHYILHTLATLEKHPNPEDWSDTCMKMFIKNREPEESWVD